jgi:1,4-alpha-glucan branching enzyme
MNRTTATPARNDRASLIGDVDLHLFNEGTHTSLYEAMGAHPGSKDGKDGTYFAVWAPNARSVEVIGDWTHWSSGVPLAARGSSGIWEGFVPGVAKGALYKYRIVSRERDYKVDKADPFGFLHETPPKTASVVWDHEYEWNDEAWMAKRGEHQGLESPVSIYEVHLGSFMRSPDAPGGFLSYRDLAHRLVDRVKELGFTHVELLPIMEHPFYGSWGYQVTGFFAPTSRYGNPQDLMYLIDLLHRNDIGVILDWVPAHFPNDEHGLGYFDGTHLFEHADPRQGFHPDWKSYIFNYGRLEVRSFLLSSACFWLDKFHIDGLRVDGVASMLYLDYSREEGEWIPNEHGGRENLEAISFLRQFNEAVYRQFPDAQTIAEESTAWPMVSRPTWAGGLGFGFKWDMGWMHDTLQYMQHDPIHRRYHHGELTFRGVYAFQENFVLPLSHDEVVHGKGSLIDKMPGDDWQKFANLRLLYTYMFSTPGKKLLFMGCEFAQWSEWKHDQALDMHLEQYDQHRGIRELVSHLARSYRAVPALHQLDSSHEGFEWIDANDSDNSVLSFVRKDRDGNVVVCAFNFTPVPRHNHRLGVPREGFWGELVNTDAAEYGGSGHGNMGGVEATPVPAHGRPWSVNITLPPLGALLLQLE